MTAPGTATGIALAVMVEELRARLIALVSTAHTGAVAAEPEGAAR